MRSQVISKSQEKLRILMISQELPYKNVRHAGGKTFYYCLTRLAEEANITLLSFCDVDEIMKAEELRGIGLTDVHIVPVNKNATGAAKVVRRLRRIIWILSQPESAVFHGPGEWAAMVNKLELVSNRISHFDIIQFEWTSSLAFINEATRLFPGARKIASLHDFNTVALERRMAVERSPWRRYLYRKQQDFEVKKIKQCDLVLVHSPADVNRLTSAGVAGHKVQWLCPYYTDLEGCTLKAGITQGSKDALHLLFFGAMYRKENWKSVIEFIVNVLHPLREQGYDIRFTVLGADPPPHLLRFHDGKSIKILGYVEEIKPFFARANVFVAPLVLGGGIKVKVLEAMSAGLPIIGNDIAMEGIDAQPNIEYIHAGDWEEWREVLKDLYLNREMIPRIGAAGLKFVKNRFNINISYERLISLYSNFIRSS